MNTLAAKRPLAGGFSRRGACPALSAPMRTGDGLLVRLNPVAGGLSPAQLAGLCDAADLHGNGIIEVTARGSIQIRGLTEGSAALFAQAVHRLGISVRTGVPVQTGVLAGLDPQEISDPTRLADMIRSAIAEAGLEGRLGPKVSVAIDGGGRTALDEVSADVRLTAISNAGWQVAIAGDALTARVLGLAADDAAAFSATLELLLAIASLGREARARDLAEDELHHVVSGLRSCMPPSGLSAISPTRGEIGSFGTALFPAVLASGEGSGEGVISPLVGEMADRPEGGAKRRDFAGSLIGTTDLRNNQVALGVALPFGHTNSRLLKTFADSATSLGIQDIRPSPGRTLVAICETAAQAEALRKLAQKLDFVTSPDDARLSISACPGAPDCASGHIPSRQMAAEIANDLSSLLDGSVHLHVSGCAKGCAHPGVATLTLVGSAAGTGLVINGTARDETLSNSDSAGRGFAHVARLVSARRLPHETTAQAVQRLGLSILAEAFGRRDT
jgi:precorrin-3B synthase